MMHGQKNIKLYLCIKSIIQIITKENNFSQIHF